LNHKQAEELGQIYVEWNIRTITSNEAMYRVRKLFPRICMRKWREYCASMEATRS